MIGSVYSAQWQRIRQLGRELRFFQLHQKSPLLDWAAAFAKGDAVGVLFHGSTAFENVETISGNVNFSPALHSVFGREYRVIEIQDNQGTYLGPITAKTVPEI